MTERHGGEGFRRRRWHQQRAEGRDEAENRKRNPICPFVAVVDSGKLNFFQMPLLPSAAIDAIQIPVFRTAAIDCIQMLVFRTTAIAFCRRHYELILSIFSPAN